MRDENPYRAPQATIADSAPQERLPIEPAGRWRRFFNLLIDNACCQLLSIVVFVPYVVHVALTAGEAGLDAIEETNFLRDYGIGLLCMLAYYIVLEGFFGFTVGKLITGTRVVDERGARPGWGRILGRTFARFIPFEPFSVLLSDDRERRGWHDSLSGTYVVRRRR